MKESARKMGAPPSSSAPVYFFGMIGALVYYIQVADGFGPIVVAILKAIVWPAFLVHGLLKFIAQ